MNNTATNREAIVTPGLVRWAVKVARRYEARTGDRSGAFEPAAALALARAVHNYDPDRGEFPSHARHCVKQALNETMRRTGPRGYRHDPRYPRHWEGAPTTTYLGPAIAPAADEPPVGWEVDYEDWVDGLSRTLPGRQGETLRMLYLDCRGVTFTGAARVLGLSEARIHAIHGAALATIHRRIARSPGRHAREATR